MASLFGYNIAPGTSAEDLAARRQLAYTLLQEGSSAAPAGHWAEGANRIAKALLGGYETSLLNQQGVDERTEASKLIGEALSGGSGASTGAPMAGGLSPSGGSTTNLPAPAVQPAQASAAAAGRDYAPTPAGNMNPVNVIKGFEGYTAKAMPDFKQTSIGYGTKALPGETEITPPVAEARLNQEQQKVADFVDQNLPGLDPVKRSALVSFGYNLGIGKGGLSDLIPAAKAGRWDQVAATMQRYNHAGGEVNSGLTNRRAQEAAMLSGGSGPAPSAPQTVAVGNAPSRSPLGVDTNTAAIIQKLSMNRLTAPIAQKLLEAALTPQNKIGRYRIARQGILDTVNGIIVPGTEKMGSDAETGTTPQYYEDPESKEIQMGVIAKDGSFRAVKTPGRILPPTSTFNTGTSVRTQTKAGGIPVSDTPIDVAGKAAQTATGKAAGEAQAMIPAAQNAVNNAKEVIDLVRSHPGIDAATGLNSLLRPENYVRGTDAYNFAVMNATVMAQAFMAAREGLKGAGQVTDFEGEKGEQAIANLTTKQSKEQYLENLARLEKMMNGSFEALQKKAGMAGGGASGDAGDGVVKWERGPDGIPRKVQ